MRHVSWTLALLLMSVAWSGCISGDDPLTPAAKAPDTLSAPTTLVTDPVTGMLSANAPVWNVGDSWTIEARQPSGTTTFEIVVVASGSSYTVATTSKDNAAYDALWDISFIGPIRPADLAGSQHGEPVRFFNFPLEANKTWTTTWDMKPVTITATPKTNGNGFNLVARDGDDIQATYDYDPELRWWSHVDFGGDYSIHISKRKENWTGTYYTGTSNVLLELTSSSPTMTMPQGTFTVSEGQEFVHLYVVGSSKAHVRALAITDPSGAPYFGDGENVASNPNPSETETEEKLPPTPGTWRIATPMLHEDGGYKVVVSEIALISTELA